jgi:UDP-3-O-[3-hydroxymyristoyl] glucosamine N-acyltransferase
VSHTLGELADRFGCELHGDAAQRVARVGTLGGARSDAVTFLANPAYRRQLAATRAAAVVLEAKFRRECPVACLVHAHPYLAYARIATFLHPPPVAVPGVHAAAVVAPDARVPPSAEIGPAAVVGAGAGVGDGVVGGAGTVVGAGANVGAGTVLEARVTLGTGVVIGERCIVHSGAVIGSDGFGFARDGAEWVKIPQIGGVRIGNDVEIGANATIDRGTIEDTVVGDGVKIDNLVQIAHNARIGAHTIMAAMSGVAGSTKVGERCMIGGGAVVSNQLTICDDVMLTFRSVVTRSIKAPGTYSGTLPAEEAKRWRRNAARFGRLDALADRVQALERRVRGAASRRGEDDEDYDNDEQL